MSERMIVKTIRDHVKRQNNNWKFVYGRQTFDKESFLEKLSKDKKFRRLVTKMVVTLSIDILTRKGEETG